MTELDATFHELVTRLAHIQARKAELEAEENEIKGKLGESLDEDTFTIDGKPVLEVRTGKRFDPTLAAQVLPDELATLCRATVIDPKLAKRVLPPAVYEQCQRANSKTTVQVR